MQSGAWKYPERTAIFVGDFIDRGSQQLETLQIARAMIEGGYAQAVMGNHKLNAIAYYQLDPEDPGQHLRPRDHKNTGQHAAFLHEVKVDSAAHKEWTDWFPSLPLWLDLEELRVVHA